MNPRLAAAALALSLLPLPGAAAAGPVPAAAPPALAEVRAAMGIPSADDMRGQRDTVGFASTAAQMARVWELAGSPPAPERFGSRPAPGAAGVIAPHDDYLYSGRVARETLSLLTARTVVLVGVFHKYRAFGARDQLVFDPYRAWRAPDGEIPVAALREELLAALPAGLAVQDAAMHDAEHSLESLAYWLRHARPDLEIVPILVPAASFPRLEALGVALGRALAEAMTRHGWRLGRDVAIAISADAVHYGDDFAHVPFGAGGIETYRQAVARDLALLRGPLAGPVDSAAAHALFATFVDPEAPDQYRLPWCGRFSIPLGMLALAETARALGLPPLESRPLAYATSVGQPELPVREIGLGATAPANLYHFVGQPGVAFVLPAAPEP